MAYRIRRKRGPGSPTGRLTLQSYRHIGFFDTLLGILRTHWQDLIDGAWFIPGLVALSGFLLAFLLLNLDRTLGPGAAWFGFSGSVTTANSLLSTISSGLLTIGGLVISITLVTLQLVSSQFTSRALRGFLSDRITQVVIGGFFGIIAYCLLVLISLRDAEGTSSLFLPEISVSVAIILAFIGLILLLVFVSHTVHSIQVSHITARIAHQTLDALRNPYPGWGSRTNDEKRTDLIQQWAEQEAPTGIYAASVGYVQTISLYYLAKLAQESHLRVSLLVCPGDFVTSEAVIAEVWPAEAVDASIVEEFQSCISIVRERDMEQDSAYGVRLLADISLRALSPAINDPTTAVLCIGYLEAIFERVISLPPLTDIKYLDENSVLVAHHRSLQEYLEVLVEIGRYATSNARIVITLLEALVRIAEATTAHNRAICLALVETIAVSVATPAIKQAHTDLDRTMVSESLERVQKITGTANPAYDATSNTVSIE